MPGSFDPGEHTVDEVTAYVAKHPKEADAVLAAERSGKNRVTLVDQLDEPTAATATAATASATPPQAGTRATTTDTKDYNGRALVDIATTAKDYMGRLVLTGDKDYMNRDTVA